MPLSDIIKEIKYLFIFINFHNIKHLFKYILLCIIKTFFYDIKNLMLDSSQLNQKKRKRN